MKSSSNLPAGERFSAFFDEWVRQLDVYLNQLLKVSKEGSMTEGEQRGLVSKLTTHYKEYYTVKWAAAHEDVFAFYSSVWLTKLEKAYSWITGWKPSVMFRVVESMRRVTELSEEQVRKIEQLRVKIRLEEEKVEREMERQQVAMADRKMVELVRMVRKQVLPVGQVDGLVQVALKAIMAGLERVMKAADCVRLKAMKGVLDVLNPVQSLEFLAGACMLQIQLRKWGKIRDIQQKGPMMLDLELHNNVIFQEKKRKVR